jgi:DNA-binding FrmR family transcriptional regulator
MFSFSARGNMSHNTKLSNESETKATHPNGSIQTEDIHHEHKNDLPHDTLDHSHHWHDHRDSIRRLKSAEGHLRGIQHMLEEDAYCIDIIQQIQAVKAALNKVAIQILKQHLNTCVITAVRGEDIRERERVLQELVDLFEAIERT